MELEGDNSFCGRFGWGAGLKDGVPIRKRRGGSPRTMLFKAVLCPGVDKMCKACSEKEIGGSAFLAKKKKLCNNNSKYDQHLLEAKEIKEREISTFL